MDSDNGSLRGKCPQILFTHGKQGALAPFIRIKLLAIEIVLLNDVATAEGMVIATSPSNFSHCSALAVL